MSPFYNDYDELIESLSSLGMKWAAESVDPLKLASALVIVFEQGP